MMLAVIQKKLCNNQQDETRYRISNRIIKIKGVIKMESHLLYFCTNIVLSGYSDVYLG